MIRTLSSIKLTFVLLFFLTLLMGIGIFFTRVDGYKQAMVLMGEFLIYDFFKAHWKDNIVLLIWVLSICAASVLLIINTVFCSFTHQLKIALKRATLRKWSFFVIHITFLIVLSCHGISMISGSKKTDVKLFEGDSVFLNNIKIKVIKVNFSDDVEMLKLSPQKSRDLMTRKTFHRKKNYAELSVFENEKEVCQGKVFMLNPLKYKSIQITAIRFLYKNINGDESLGINLTIIKNGFTGFFFIIYGVMITTLICFLVITWKPQKSMGVDRP
jgi:hypothetical protein